MSKKIISVFNQLRLRKKKKDSILIINSNQQLKTINATHALNTAERALNNLSLLVEKNKETYKRSQILLMRANAMYNSEGRVGIPYGEQ